MPKVKPILYASKTLKDGTHPVMLRVSHKKDRKYYKLGFSCTPTQWDRENSKFKKTYPKYRTRNKFVTQRLYEAEDIIEKMVIDRQDFSFDELKKQLLGIEPKDLIGYFDEIILRLRETGKNGNADIYKNVRNSIAKYLKGRKINFHQVDTAFLNKYVEHLQKRDLQNNSINLYLRTFRSLFNKAIAENLCSKDQYPFNKFKFSKIKNDPDRKALTKQQIQLIFDYEPDPNTSELRSKDIFLFSYLTRGMNFKDIALLKWKNIRNDRIEYVRSKTGKSFSIRILPASRKILNFYKEFNPSSEHIFPIFNKRHKTDIQKRDRRKSVLKRVNKHLKHIAELLGIETTLTFYIARHTYAMVLKNQGADISKISDALGHQNVDVTKNYLESFGNEILDEMDDKFLKF